MKLFLLITLFSSYAFAAKYNFKNYWSDSGYVKADKHSSFKVLIKKSPIFPDSSIAAVTITKNNQESKNTVISLFKTSVGNDCKWRSEKIDGLEIHECVSLKTGSLFRLAFNDKTQQFSTGSVALRYLMPTYAELHLLQTQQLTGTKPSAAKKTAWLIELLNQKAYAQTIPVDLSNYLVSTGNSILANSNGALNNVADAGKSVAGSVNNIADAGKDLAQSGKDIAQSGKNIADSVNNASNQMNRTVKDTLSTRNVAKLSAVAGVTFGLTSTLTAMATNFLVNGTYTMLRTLFYEAKGEFTPEQKKMRLERFEKSLKNFQELEPAMNDMANKLAVASAELTIASGVSSEEFLAKIDRDITAIKENRIEESVDCLPCTTEEKALKIRQLEDFKKIILAADKARPRIAVCENIESLYRNWVNAEYTLLNSRRLIMQDMRLFNGTIIDGVENQTNFQENRKLNNACLDSAESNLNKAKRDLEGKNCDDDMSSVLCQKYEAYKGMVESCQEMAKQKSSERDEAELLTATSNVSKVLGQFSRELGALSCDGKNQSCSPGKLDRVRTDMKDIFTNAGKQCPQFFFARQVAPRTPSSAVSPAESAPAPAAGVVAAAEVTASPTIWSKIKNFFNTPRQVNVKAAEDIYAGN